MKKQLKLLFFVAMLVTLAVMTMVFVSAADEYQLTKKDGETETVVGTYSTLQEAVNAAKNGYTIKVTATVTVTATEVKGKTITIDGGNYLMTLPAQVNWLTVGDGADLTMTNMYVTYTGKAGLSHAVIAVSGDNAKLTIKGANTFVYNASGSTSSKAASASTSHLLRVTNATAVANIEGGETDDQKVKIYSIGHGFGIGTTAGALNVVNAIVQDTCPIAPYSSIKQTASSGLIDVVGGTANLVNSSVTKINTTGSVISAGSGILNVINSSISGNRALNAGPVSGGANDATVNVIGEDTVINSTKDFAIGFRYANSAEINVFGGKFTGTHLVRFAAAGGTVNVYGGTFSPENGKGFVVYITTEGDFKIFDKDAVSPEIEYKVYENGAWVAKAETFTAKVTELRHTTNNILYSTVATSTVYLGNGTVIYLEGDCSLDSRFTINEENYTVGEIDIYFLGGNEDLEADSYPNLNGGSKFPAVHLAKYANTTFHFAASDIVLKTEETVNGPDDLDALVTEYDATWKTYTAKGGTGKYEYLDGATPGFIVSTGAVITIVGGEFTNITTLMTVAGGELHITGGTFEAASSASGTMSMIVINSGILEITGDPHFIVADWTEAANVGIIAVYGGKVTIACEESYEVVGGDYNNVTGANFEITKNGCVILVDSVNADITVTSGVFFRKSNTLNGSAPYYVGGLFYFTQAGYTKDLAVDLTINGGHYFANSLVRIWAAVNADGNDTKDYVATDLNQVFEGVNVTLTAGEFVSNLVEGYNSNTSYAFQIARAGKHTITFPEGSTFTVKLNEHSGPCFVTNSAGGIFGTTFDIEGGTFELADNALLSIKAGSSAVTIILKNITVTQTGACNMLIIFQCVDTTNTITTVEDDPNTTEDETQTKTETVKSTLTVDKVTLNTEATVLFHLANDAVLTVESGTFIAQKLFNQATKEHAVTITLNGGLYVLTGTYAEGEDMLGGFLAYASSTVTFKDVVFVAQAGTVINSDITLDKYDPSIKYGEDLTLKIWMTRVATNEDYAPVFVGADLYLGENGLGTDLEKSGIRFKSTVSASVLDALMESGADVAIGHLIAPAEYVAMAGAFTIEALEGLGDEEGDILYGKTTCIAKEVDFENNPPLPDNEEEPTQYSFAVALVSLNNYERSYAVVPYIRVGETYYYGEYKSTDNACSAQELAYEISVSNPTLYENTPALQEYYKDEQ